MLQCTLPHCAPAAYPASGRLPSLSTLHRIFLFNEIVNSDTGRQPSEAALPCEGELSRLRSGGTPASLLFSRHVGCRSVRGPGLLDERAEETSGLKFWDARPRIPTAKLSFSPPGLEHAKPSIRDRATITDVVHEVVARMFVARMFSCFFDRTCIIPPSRKIYL